MENELSLTLTTPVEELIPKLIAFNNEELLLKVSETLKQYDGVAYTEDQVDIAKKDRAQLNNFCKTLNDERIRIGKVYSSPYDKFKKQVDEVIDRVKETINTIDNQVKAYEVEKQEKKQNEIIEYFKDAVSEFSGLIPYEKIHQAKWLNVSVSMKSVKSDIDAIITNAKNAMVAIEALHSEDENLIKTFYFRTLDLSTTLLENERLRADKQKIAEAQAAQKTEEVKVVKEEPVKEIKDEARTPIDFRIYATQAELQLLKDFLIKNNIKYGRVPKEEK